MRDATLCLLIDTNRICLARKKRDFGKGKWNGVGGKVEDGETVEQATLRELEEEIGVRAEEEHLEKVGDLELYYDDTPDWNQRMHIFTLQKWDGEPSESDEMYPQWFTYDEIPFGDMWTDDSVWLPQVLDGKRLKGQFFFQNAGAEIRKHILEEF